VATGSVPDFSFDGQGVRIADLAPDSPAAKAGLQKGDVIVNLGGKNITSLRDYSDALKSHTPGDVVEIVYQRAGKENKTKIELIAK
jgi:S1-C subfamily serine protease